MFARFVARDAGGPLITGQVLVAPVTDADFTRPSYSTNPEGYMLTTPLMRWFWEHLLAVDVIASGASARQEMGLALRQFATRAKEPAA